MERGESQRILAEGERHERQAVITRVAEGRRNNDRHQNRSFEAQEFSEKKSEQPDQGAESYCKTHGRDDLDRLELRVYQQIKDQDGTEDIKDHPAQAARIDRDGFAKQKARPADQQDGQEVVGKGG